MPESKLDLAGGGPSTSEQALLLTDVINDRLLPEVKMSVHEPGPV